MVLRGQHGADIENVGVLRSAGMGNALLWYGGGWGGLPEGAGAGN